MLTSILDGIVFTSVWVSAAAVTLYLASSLAMHSAPSASVAGIIAAGTLVVYNVDRLRDVARDRGVAPARSAFVMSHRDALRTLVAGAGLVCVYLVIRLDREEILLLMAVLGLGLLHRRLKWIPVLNAAYLTGSWLAVVVGLPALGGPAASRWLWIAAVLGTALCANAVASSARDAEAGAARFGKRRAIATARTVAAGGVLVGLTAPPPLRPLVSVPMATLAALIGFRPTGRYGLVVVDGALLVGAAVAILLL